MTSDFSTKIAKVKTALENVFVKKSDRSHISYGQVDNTSTATAFTATVDGLTTLTDGTTVMLRNGVITSAEGFTLEVNGLGAKPVYSNLANATRDTTIFNINYTMLFVYDSTRVDGGCWICYRGYDSNTNTVGYQIRTNSTPFTATDKGYKYRLWLETDGNKYMPVNTSTSINATANRSSAMNTREFWIGGKILYNATNGTTNANATMSATTLWQQYTLTLGYSFNNTGSALTLTLNKPLYMVAKAKGNGKAQLNTPYYTQTLPSTEDGLIYIYLGHMYSATALELALDHPVYEYKNGAVRLYRDYYTTGEMDTLLSGKSNTGHTHTVSNITDFPSTITPSSHTHGNLQNDGSVGTSNNASKNVVTDSNGKITTEAKPTIPSKISDLTNDSNFIETSSTNGLVKNNGTIDTNTYLTTSVASSIYVAKETGKGLFSGSYNDLTNKPSFTQDSNISSSSTESYPIGTLNISGSDVTIYGKDTNTVYEHPTPQTLGGVKTYGLYKTTIDAKGHIINVGNVEASDLPSHTHTISNVTNLQSTLNGKANTSDLSDVAFSNDYDDLDNLPTIPAAYTHPSTHPATMITGLSTVATSGSYNDLSNKPSIPTDVSQLTDTQNTTFTPKSHAHIWTDIDDWSIEDTTNLFNLDTSEMILYSFGGILEYDYDNNALNLNSGNITIDMVNSILSSGNIKNNLTTTTSGGVLDARQGKWLNDNKASSTHTHGNINNDGTITTVKTIDSNTNIGADYFIIRENSGNATKSANILDVFNKIIEDLIDEGDS